MHEGAPRFQYAAADDGGTVVLVLEPAPNDAGASIELRRSPHGLGGQTRAFASTPSGRICPVTFPTEAVSCADGGLTLRAVTRASLNEACLPPTAGGPPVFLVHRLLRTDLPAAAVRDAGPTPDAG